MDVEAPPLVPLSFIDKVQVPRYTAGFRGENVVSANGSSSMAESPLDRKFIGNITVEKAIYIAVFIVAIVLRTYSLGPRPYHHDESIHAFYSWKVTDAGLGDYRYDPVYHGPVLYYSSAAVMFLLGDNDFTGRLSAVIFGLIVLAYAWPMRHYLGRTAALAFLILLSLSPSFTYFTRFVRHDIYMALGTLMFAFHAFRYGETKTAWHLYLAGVGMAIAFCTKEDMYAMGPVLLVALFLTVLWEWVNGQRTLGDVIAETTSTLRQALLPLLTTSVIFAGIWLVLYTSFLNHPENWNAVTRALKYWWGQHEIKRIGGPFWYYLPQLTVYDPIIFYGAIAVMLGPFLAGGSKDRVLHWMRYGVLAALGVFAVMAWRGIEHAQVAIVAALGFAQIGVARVWLPDRFTRFAIFWSLGALCFYGWAQEKVPWLLVPQVLPLAIVAALGMRNIVTSGAWRSVQTGLPLALVSALTLWTLIASNFLYDAPIAAEPKERRHAEMLAYVQSTYDIDRIMKRIESVGATLGTGTQTRLQVSGDATWPFSWYLRHYPVNWGANVRNVDTPVVIVDPSVRKSLEPALGETYEVLPFEIRGWWEPNWREATPPNVLRFLFTRRAWNPAGSSDGVAFVYKNPQPGMQFAKIAVDPPPSARAYPNDPELQQPVAVWGQKGANPGQFNEPRGLTTDASGNLYVVDSKNNRIQKLSSSGAVLTTWGTAGSGDGELKDPGGIAIGPDGNLYVADTWNHRVQKFDPSGKFLEQWGTENPGFWGPRGIAVASDGKVFVTDTGNKRVVSFTSSGTLIEAWGQEGSKPGQFIEPVGIAIDGEGNVVVVDTGNRRLQFFEPDSTFLKELPLFGLEEFYTEPYLSVAGNDFWITDSYNHRFARYRDGQITGSWGKSGSGNGEFNRPIGVTADTAGNVYVSDTMNHRIQKYVLE
jgi:uncharacterized protein (TIGR03663 family)